MGVVNAKVKLDADCALIDQYPLETSAVIGIGPGIDHRRLPRYDMFISKNMDVIRTARYLSTAALRSLGRAINSRAKAISL